MRLVQAATGAAAALALTLGLACGDDAREAATVGPLHWVGKPAAVPASDLLPDDRIVSGRVENRSLQPVELDARQVRLVDADDRGVRASVAFLDSFGRAWEVYNKGPLALPREEWRRLGRLVRIEPGQEVPLTVSWSGGEPRRIAYAGGALALP